jgi:hypothetical protein
MDYQRIIKVAAKVLAILSSDVSQKEQRCNAASKELGLTERRLAVFAMKVLKGSSFTIDTDEPEIYRPLAAHMGASVTEVNRRQVDHPGVMATIDRPDITALRIDPGCLAQH